MKQPRYLVAAILCALTCLLLRPSSAEAQEGFAGLCSLFLHAEQTELEDAELAVQMDATSLGVAQEIFQLLDSLWQNDLVGHLPYLGAKHRYDAAAINLQRAQKQLDRQQAVVDQYGLACGVQPDEEQTSDDRGSLEDVRQRYLDADCELRVLDVALYEIDLEYHQEMLASAADLRQSDIASRQQVLFAEEDVQLTLQKLQQARQRVASCRQ